MRGLWLARPAVSALAISTVVAAISPASAQERTAPDGRGESPPAAAAQDVPGAVRSEGQAGTKVRPGSQGQAVSEDRSVRTADGQNAADIVVTANKREERLNDVPAAVSAFTAEDRTIRGINTTQDIANFTPGLAIADSPPRVNIRGVGRVTNELGSDPGVADYVDGFYTSAADVIGGSDFLVERVEVLRGPQGTLYGRNSIGGAVNVISKRPTTELRVEARAFVNSYERYGGAASLSGPITDWLRFRVAAIGAKQDKGYVKNLAGPRQWTDERYTVEAQLEADITSNLNAWVRVAHTRYDQSPPVVAVIDPYPTVPYFGGLVANPTFGLAPADNPSAGDPFRVSYNFDNHEKLNNNFTATTNITLTTDPVIVRYVGGYSQYDYYADRDFDQTSRTSFPRAAFGTTFPVSTNYVELTREFKRWNSLELNFLSPPGGTIDWILGEYYYHETIDQPYAITVPNVALFDDPVELAGVAPISNPDRAYYAQRGRLSSTSLAAFGQLTVHPAATFSIDLGARYSYDQKRGREDQLQVFYNVAVDPGHTYGVLNRGRDLRGNWGGFTGNLGLNFQPTAATLAYAKVSRGYKSGGFRLGALAPNPSVGDEHITAYEVGLKQGIGRLQWNSAAFYYDYRDLQVPVSLQVAPGVIQTVFYNAPKARSYGFETELNLRPVHALQLSAIYSYLNAKFRDFSGVVDPASASSAPQDLSGADLPQSPRHKLTLNGVLSFGPLDFSATQSFVSSQYFQVFNTDRYQADSYRNTSLRLTYTAPEERFRLIASVSNLFDVTSYSYVNATSFATGALRTAIPRLPRLFELEGRVRF